MTAAVELRDVMWIGENDQGYRFGVGRIENRWIGFARGDGILFVMPEISDGATMGYESKAQTIKATCAIALNPDDAFGGIDRWFIPPGERGTAADYPADPEFDCFDDEFDGFYDVSDEGDS